MMEREGEGGVGWRDGCSSSRVRGGAGRSTRCSAHREEGVLEITYPNLKHHLYQACTSITIHVCPLLGRPDQPSARLPHVGHVGPASPRLRYCTPGTAQQLPGCLLTAYYQPITSQNRNRVLLLRHSWSLLTAYYCLLAY